jgi:hypothetical protein
VLVAIDPGVNGCGVSVWTNYGALVRAEYVVNADPQPGLRKVQEFPKWLRMAWALGETEERLVELVIEVPQAYSGRDKQKGDQNDLILLALTVGAIAGHFWPDQLTTYLPREWKGQLPKDVSERRSREELRESEVSLVKLPKAKSLHNNVWDSVGIGLFHLNKRKLRAWK